MKNNIGKIYFEKTLSKHELHNFRTKNYQPWCSFQEILQRNKITLQILRVGKADKTSSI